MWTWAFPSSKLSLSLKLFTPRLQAVKLLRLNFLKKIFVKNRLFQKKKTKIQNPSHRSRPFLIVLYKISFNLWEAISLFDEGGNVSSGYLKKINMKPMFICIFDKNIRSTRSFLVKQQPNNFRQKNFTPWPSSRDFYREIPEWYHHCVNLSLKLLNFCSFFILDHK